MMSQFTHARGRRRESLRVDGHERPDARRDAEQTRDEDRDPLHRIGVRLSRAGACHGRGGVRSSWVVGSGGDSSAPARLHPAARSRFAALHTRDYRRYFAVSLTAMTADNIEHVISYWVIYQAFHSPMLAGFAVISHWMPFLLFSVYSGALADRYDCRKLIQAGQILFMVASLSWGAAFPHRDAPDVARGGAPPAPRRGRCDGGARHAADPPRHGRARAASERDPSERHGPLPRHPARAGRRRWAHAAARPGVGAPRQCADLCAVLDLSLDHPLYGPPARRRRGAARGAPRARGTRCGCSERSAAIGGSSS